MENALDYLWASDQDDLIAVLQPTRVLLVSTKQKRDSPYPCMHAEATDKLPSGNSYIIDFSGLCAKVLCLSSFLKYTDADPETCSIVRYTAEPLLHMRRLTHLHRDDPDIVDEHGSLHHAVALAAGFDHSILWTLLASAALKYEQWKIAEEAFVR